MARLPTRAVDSAAAYPWKVRLIGLTAATLIWLWGRTCRWRLVDPAGMCASDATHRRIFIVWHNRIFGIEGAFHFFMPKIQGAILTSASRDGEIIAATMSRFGAAIVRGSSSRRGVSALLELRNWIRDGYDVLVVPDGPRGPRYRLGPGVIKLAQVSGAAILPMRIDYARYWSFKSWDQFRLPKPFTTITVTLEPAQFLASELDEATFEAERRRIELLLNPTHETD